MIFIKKIRLNYTLLILIYKEVMAFYARVIVIFKREIVEMNMEESRTLGCTIK